MGPGGIADPFEITPLPQCKLLKQPGELNYVAQTKRKGRESGAKGPPHVCKSGPVAALELVVYPRNLDAQRIASIRIVAGTGPVAELDSKHDAAVGVIVDESRIHVHGDGDCDLTRDEVRQTDRGSRLVGNARNMALEISNSSVEIGAWKESDLGVGAKLVHNAEHHLI